ncbi:CMGC/SRPK protein kinase [Nannizzia gypsea CBS 118893]|uniref:non-specific serine/threonine protein kinase n=1 Tax=Arthroderma gypseum (strain ATCC MYA-4604 / CBS 118893) TaxID=535722 RepID=E5QZM0_ARTGP|nr:CMGC/SRPK protein kinase [Nannizzia gypsea CBS 118893]EFQ97386.1 CMGC/SRPK protein kinase [Nannizzia gypsea CBS 118893]
MYCSNPASDLETHCRYQYIDDVEKLERYKPGGYHPVLIGDVLHSRYQVVHELGYGTYSTVWLAYDQQRAAYSVVKICTADAPLREVEILHRLTKYRPNTQPGLAILPTIQDDFEIQGPNGRHRCYVSQTASCSVADAKFCCFFKIPVARAVVAQMILAVEYIHSHGYVHADLHLKNFLFRLPSSYDKFLPEHIYNRFGEPCKAPVVRLDGEPLPPNAPIYGPRSPRRLAAEVLFALGKNLSFASDVWALACASWSIFGMRSLFDGTLATKDDIASQQIDTLGISSLPPEWWAEWDARHEYFDEGGQLLGNRTVFPPLEQAFEEENNLYEGTRGLTCSVKRRKWLFWLCFGRCSFFSLGNGLLRDLC